MPQTAAFSPAAADVLAAALALPAEQRVALTDRLLDDLDAAQERPPFQATEAEMAELYRLVDDVRAGRVEMIPGEDVLAELELDGRETAVGHAVESDGVGR